MIDTLVSSFLQSSAGAEVLGQLKTLGLAEPQAQAAVSATAEGAVQQLGGESQGLAGLASQLLGGGAGGVDLASLAAQALGQGGGGALGGLAGAILGGGAPAATPQAGGLAGGLAALAGPVADFVARKTGLAPAMATAAVNMVLPRLLELLSGQPAAGAPPASGSGGLLGGLLG